jgi:hypothetical protein
MAQATGQEHTCSTEAHREAGSSVSTAACVAIVRFQRPQAGTPEAVAVARLACSLLSDSCMSADAIADRLLSWSRASEDSMLLPFSATEPRSLPQGVRQ